MARRTFNDIDGELLLRIANRTDVTVAMRADFIQDAYLSVAIKYKHPEIQKVTISESIAQGSDNLIPVATDLWYPTALRNITDGYIIRQESLERVERLQTKPSAPPYCYHWYGRVFYFESFANTVKQVKIWYKRKPTSFATTSSSELDEIFDPCIVMESARLALETVREFDEAGKQQGLLANYEASRKLPLEEAKLNDYRQGWKVRFK